MLAVGVYTILDIRYCDKYFFMYLIHNYTQFIKIICIYHHAPNIIKLIIIISFVKRRQLKINTSNIGA